MVLLPRCPLQASSAGGGTGDPVTRDCVYVYRNSTSGVRKGANERDREERVCEKERKRKRKAKRDERK